MNKWIWFVVVTIFNMLSIAHSSCDDLCGLDRIVVENQNIEDKVTNQFRKGQGHLLNCLDTTNVTDMTHLFSANFNKIFKDFNEDISCWDTSNVKTMLGMFNGASSFNRDISSWDTSGVTNMGYMFEGASLFGKRICNWNVNQVTFSSKMFTGSRCTETSCLDCTYAPTSITSPVPPTPEPPKSFEAKSKRMCDHNFAIEFFKEGSGCDVECNKVESCVAYQVMRGVGCTLFSGTNSFKSGDKFSAFDCRKNKSKKENRICDPRGIISLSKGSKLSKCKKACKKDEKCKYHMLVKNENCLLFGKIGKATTSKKKLMKKFTCHTRS